MKRNILTFITFICILFTAKAQTKDLTVGMLKQAKDMSKLFLAKDYAAFSKYTHPNVVKSMGGDKNMVTTLKKSFEEIEADGITFLTIDFGTPSEMLTVGDELQCTVPQMIEMKVPGGKVTANTTLIALSPDKGAHWYFIDVASNNLATMKQLIPSLSDSLVLPTPTDASFEADPAPAPAETKP